MNPEPPMDIAQIAATRRTAKAFDPGRRIPDSVFEQVRALNAEGTEIGRARKLVVLEKADAKYVPFEFDEEMDTAMVKKYEIGL